LSRLRPDLRSLRMGKSIARRHRRNACPIISAERGKCREIFEAAKGAPRLRIFWLIGPPLDVAAVGLAQSVQKAAIVDGEMEAAGVDAHAQAAIFDEVVDRYARRAEA